MALEDEGIGIAHLSGKLYGMRSHKHKQKEVIRNVKNLLA